MIIYFRKYTMDGFPSTVGRNPSRWMKIKPGGWKSYRMVGFSSRLQEITPCMVIEDTGREEPLGSGTSGIAKLSPSFK